MVINTKLTLAGNTLVDAYSMRVNRTISDFNLASYFEAKFSNERGRNHTNFNLNQEVIIYSDMDATPTTRVFCGVIEDINFDSEGTTEKVMISGRDYSVFLQDIVCEPRIFTDMEISDIVRALLIQNLGDIPITFNNVDYVGEIINKITFNNITLFDAIMQLAEIAGYYFYVDVNKDVHFEARATVSSGVTLDNTNIPEASFRYSDADIYNNIIVYGDRQLTGVREFFTGFTIGSRYILDDRPHSVTLLGSPNFVIQPGGILNVDNPQSQDVKYLVDFSNQSIVLTSGTTAGNNLGWGGSPVIVDYQRSSPIISIRADDTSILAYGRKDKRITDRNIKDLSEANQQANTFLSEHKDLRIQGTLNAYGIIDVTPGKLYTVNIPHQNINSENYALINATYEFNKQNCLNNRVLKLSMNKRISNFIDYMKEHELRLRKLEGTEVDTQITSAVVASTSINVQDAWQITQRSIGSAFYFNINGHNIFNSPSSLLGYITGGSTVITA